MNKLDAANLLNLKDEITPKITKKAYRVACSKYHPDRNPAGLEMMQAINEAYEVLKDFSGFLEQTDSSNDDYANVLNEALNQVIAIKELTLELCGSWLWITGNSYPHKTLLKELGFLWASKKKAWYLKPEGERSKSKGSYSMEEVREFHGSKIIKDNIKSKYKKVANG